MSRLTITRDTSLGGSWLDTIKPDGTAIKIFSQMGSFQGEVHIPEIGSMRIRSYEAERIAR